MRLRFGILVLGFVFIQNVFAQIGGGGGYMLFSAYDVLARLQDVNIKQRITSDKSTNY